jgi:hypothetical protein
MVAEAHFLYQGGDAGRFGYLAIRCNASVTGPPPENVRAYLPVFLLENDRECFCFVIAACFFE